ncbi:MAG: hypothetical protein KJ666_05390 [Bacteroidetes bacterium]|nr:hypothetical protein [Bacteroidota bacterium]MBU2583742.1 hypothetical protein [Bacteroidota bacterium]
MKSIKSALLFALAVWVIPFVVAMFIFPIRESNRPLFESIMPVAVCAAVVIFAILYFKKVESNFIKEGVLLGIVFFGVSIIIDLAMFMWGPMKMSFGEYLSDIGVTYLLMPVITIGFGYLLQKK